MIDKYGIFEVGQRYENRKGPYEVLGITPPLLQIRYDSGEVIHADLAIQARIIENMRRSTADAGAKKSKLGAKERTRKQHPTIADAHITAPPGSALSVTLRKTGGREAIEFVSGGIYRRRDLHARYRGQEQGGICTPKNFPIILLFSGEAGDLYGYKDYWDDDNVFHYFGEGQLGDMEFIRGNRAIRDHTANGKELLLFETIGNGNVRYVSVVTCVGYDYVSNVPDASGGLRTAIVFKLSPNVGE